MNVKALLIISSLILSGCSITREEPIPIKINTVPVEKQKLDVQEPTALSPLPIEWFIITPENYEEVFKELEDKGYSVVLFGLPDDSYENLAGNLAEIRSYIIKQRSVIKAYKDYYEPVKENEKEK